MCNKKKSWKINMRREGGDPNNWFNPATFFAFPKPGTGFPNYMLWSFFVMFEVRINWPSVFKLSFSNALILILISFQTFPKPQGICISLVIVIIKLFFTRTILFHYRVFIFLRGSEIKDGHHYGALFNMGLREYE